jgi:NAD-dependent DNA ligase
MFLLDNQTLQKKNHFWKKLKDFTFFFKISNMDLLFLKNGIDYLKTLSKKEIVSLYQSANQKYYNESQPLFSDEEYDILKDYVEQVYPNEIEIGAPVSSGKKVKLPIFMGSMNKIKSDQKVLESWTKKYAGPYVCSAKLDGISALFDGRTTQKKLFTRGNGTIGQDISKFIPHLHFSSIFS